MGTIGRQPNPDDISALTASEGPAIDAHPSPTVDAARVRQQHPGAFSRNVAGTVLSNLVTPIVGIATAPVLVHALGVVGRGEFAAATAPTLLLTVAGTLGLPQAVTYFVASGRLPAGVTTGRACLQSFVFGLLLAGLVAVLASAIAGGNHRVARIMTWGALTLPFSLVVGVLRGTGAGRHRWTLVNIERGGGNFLRFILVIVFAAVGNLDLLNATLIYLVSPVIVGIVYVPMVRSLLGDQPVPEGSDSQAWRVLSYGMRIWIGGVSGVVLSRLDQVVMTPLSNSRQLGLYAAAVAIGELPYVLSGATRDVILAADASERDDLRAVQASRLTLVATLAFAGILAAASSVVIDLAYGHAFSDATSMLLLLLLASVLYTPGMTAGGILTGRGQAVLTSISVVAATAVNVILLPVLVPAWGGNGAAVASVAAYLVYSAVSLHFLTRHSSLTLRQLVLPSRGDAAWVVAMIRRAPAT